MPFFPEEWIQDLLSKVSLVDLIGEYVTLQNKGGRWWACCPFHNEKTPSFSVNPEKGFYHCFGCGKGGNAIQFVMEQEKMTFPEACQYLAEKVKLPVPENTDNAGYEKRKQQRKKIFEMNKIAARYFHENLYAPEGKSALEYLKGRGIGDRIIKTFGMGFAKDGWDHLMKMLAEKGYTKQDMQAAGLIKMSDGKSYDMFRNRAMIPIINAFGDIIGFGGRVMDDGMPKYLNSPETAAFNKSRNLYNLNLIRRQKNLSHLILVEGYMDVIALFSYGIPECVATLGTALTQDQARLIKRYTDHVYISYDGDAAGQKATLRALGILAQEGIETRVVIIPGGQDPDEYLKGHGRDGYINLMKVSLPEMDYRFGVTAAKYNLDDSHQKEKFARECANLLKQVESAVTKEKYAKKLSDMTGYSPESIMQDAGGLKQDAEWIPPKVEARETTLEEKAENCLIRRLYSDPQIALKLEGKIEEADFQNTADRKIFSHIMEKAKKGIFTANSELLSVLSEEESSYIRKVLSEEDERENADDFLNDCVKQIRLGRLERQRRNALAACSAEQDVEKKRVLLQKIDELGKKIHKLKTSF
ncbi:DNA primase [Christensenella intestinihominis]|uniref:DNA primase n=1 Tax=Christensenella intestinihominis TaxID=1851429 RepID=UPI000834CCFA|nr:DNA primase [Christensenella intestinihominis]